jgi:hypothetical protein
MGHGYDAGVMLEAATSETRASTTLHRRTREELTSK